MINLNNKKIYYGLTISSLIMSLIIGIIFEKMISGPFNIYRFYATFLGISLILNYGLSIIKEGIKNNIIIIIKFIFTTFFTTYLVYKYHILNVLIYGFIDIGLIFFLSDILIKKNKIIGNIVNDILLLAYNANICVYLFGYSYINRIMLTNIGSLDELKGNAGIYLLGTILVIVFALLPIRKINASIKKSLVVFILSFVSYIVATFSFNVVNKYMLYSPIGAYMNVVVDTLDYYRRIDARNNSNVNKKIFYKNKVTDYVKKDKNLPKNPNVIVIYTEGLSSSAIYDDRNIMPNLNQFSKESLNFINYYNHTAATFRGIIGQLYSGFQFDNYDENHLISMQSILKEKGYYTEFINIDSNSGNWNDYLESFNFDKIYVDKNRAFEGMAYSHSDKQAYEELYEQANYLNQKGQPFFLSIYTLGTHVSLDSVNEKFKDGKNNVLNRLYDCDYQFGKFLNSFKQSELVNNTIIVFTTDHASYVDKDYLSAFSNIKREASFFDKIPLYIYYKGVDAKEIDANGRTSLDLAPTLLDMLDLSGENYFLGTSLFGNENNEFDHYYYDGTDFMKTENLKIISINKFENRKTINKIYDYFGVAIKN